MMMSNPNTARAELVDALPFSSTLREEGQAFGKLSLNGAGLVILW